MNRSSVAYIALRIIFVLLAALLPFHLFAADKLVGIHSARTMSQSMPWIADEAGLFKKYALDLQLVYISSASMVTAAMLSGSGDVAISGAMAEAVNIMFKDKELTYKILGKYLRINDRKILDAAYDEEIKVMESRLEFKMDSIQAIIDETGKTDARVRRIKPQELIDRSVLHRLQNDASFDWTRKQ